ncbi:nucleotidyltransferase [Streptomyces sp. ND05-3B]|nr:nucleotidyltransferase [Streptomyces caniscabiei]MBE4742002.1 nucleotidyltransferase [Streptomyces caniscabiei]MBE4762768.1 nucleotidyltransferase [Streptomyces caniscabiei]MBE4790821.1 nucleotidyltransferase [Streptomyces caniscabiei]MBE4800007.1 nucleotidyltransferase [Streptomyces caniscabiei]
MLSMLLDGAVEVLDIAPDLHDTAIERYGEVGTWLAENGSPGWEIHSQGSFLLGTVVRPNTETGEYDIDLVCRLPLQRDSTTKEELKQRVGDQLVAYRRWKQRQGHTDGPESLEARRRCWTLGYPGFHLDVLPAIPDEKHPPTGILLTDKKLHKWQHSNPLGYADWFRARSELSRALLEKRLVASVAKVPEHHIRSTLQRLVQILKWHCMLFFAEDTDNRPPSILLTTLASRAYRGEDDLFTAVRNVLAAMPQFIKQRDGQWWVPNPAHEEENFTDKWNEYPERRQAFLAWFDEITTIMDNLALTESKGLDVVYSQLIKSFAPDPVMRSFARYGARMKASTSQRMGGTGLLSTTATGPRRKPNNFYGQHPGARG